MDKFIKMIIALHCVLLEQDGILELMIPSNA